jgi:hypothetical protein
MHLNMSLNVHHHDAGCEHVTIGAVTNNGRNTLGQNRDPMKRSYMPNEGRHCTRSPINLWHPILAGSAVNLIRL